MKFKNTQAALDDLADLLAKLGDIRDRVNSDFKRAFPQSFADALVAAGVPEHTARTDEAMLRHSFAEALDAIDLVRHHLSEAGTTMIGAREQARRGVGTGRFTV